MNTYLCIRRLGFFTAIGFIACCFVAGVNVAPSFADGTRMAQVQPSIDCTCRYQGQDYQQGDLVCLNSPNGPRMARCGFVQNNTSWNFTGMGCVYSSAERYTPRADGQPSSGLLMTPVTIQ